MASLLGLSVGQVRAWVRAGLLEPSRGPRGQLVFSFRDLVLLRAAQGLVSARIPARRVRQSLQRLRDQLPEGRSLRSLRIAADGSEIVVGDGAARFRADDGQLLFDFDTRELARKAGPVLVEIAGRQDHAEDGPSADEFYERGCDLEEAAPDEARAAYRRALELEPQHPDAHVNLGRLLHESGDPGAAAAHYRAALAARPDDPTAEFNLGVALEDLAERDEAIAAYRRALEHEPDYADAHCNLARLYEQRGNAAAALRHLRAYRNLS